MRKGYRLFVIIATIVGCGGHPNVAEPTTLIVSEDCQQYNAVELASVDVDALSKLIKELNTMKYPERAVVDSTEIVLGRFLNIDSPHDVQCCHYSEREILLHIDEVIDGEISTGTHRVAEPMDSIDSRTLETRLSETRFLFFLSLEREGYELKFEIPNPSQEEIAAIQTMARTRQSLPLGKELSEYFAHIRLGRVCNP